MTEHLYFGTDGIRGTYGKSPMDTEFMFQLGMAAALSLSNNSDKPPVFVVGRDTRTSGPALQLALVRGLREAGAHVLNLCVIPTPGIAYLTHFAGATAGVVISASHNPAEENGVKFFNGEGMKLSEEQETAIEEKISELHNHKPEMQCETLGERSPQLFEAYLQDLMTSVDGLDLSGFRILMDCSNGAACKAGPEVFRRLGADLIAINTEDDGVHINENCGSESLRANPAHLAGILKDEQADLAIAFDGDADRVIMMDELGNLIDGDQMLALLAEGLHEDGKLLANTLVTTIMANGALKKFGEDKQFNVIQTPVGDKYVTEVLLKLSGESDSEGKIGLGGEQSGHIVLLDEDHRTGDGIRSALLILKMLAQKPGLTLSKFAGRIQKNTQIVASCNVASKPDLKNLEEFQSKFQNLRNELSGLVEWNSRYSGTEPKYRLMLEADSRNSAEDVARVAWSVCDLIQEATSTAEGAKIEVLNVSQGGLMPRPTEK